MPATTAARTIGPRSLIGLIALRHVGATGFTECTTPGAGAASLRHRVPICQWNGAVAYTSSSLLQAKHEQRAARVADVGVVPERADGPKGGRGIVRSDAERNAGPRPAAYPGEHGDVLLAVGPQVGHRVADDARRALELPQLGAGGGINRLEPAFHRPVEHHAAGRRQSAAVRREVLLDLPLDPADRRIPRDEPAAVAAGARIHAHDRADVGLAGRVLHLYALVIHADVVRRHVEEFRLRGERRGLLVLEADRGRADTLGVLLRGRPVRRVAHRDAGREVDLRGPVHRPEGLGDQHLAVGPVERVAEAVAVEVHERLHRPATDRQVGEDHLVDAVVVPLVVRRHLVGPLDLSGFGVAGPYRHRPLVVAGTLIRVPAPRVAAAVVEQVQLGIIRIPTPRGPAAALPLVALPRADAEVLPAMRRVVLVGVAFDPDFSVGPGAVHRPLLLAGVDVEPADAAADSELAA